MIYRYTLVFTSLSIPNKEDFRFHCHFGLEELPLYLQQSMPNNKECFSEASPPPSFLILVSWQPFEWLRDRQHCEILVNDSSCDRRWRDSWLVMWHGTPCPRTIQLVMWQGIPWQNSIWLFTWQRALWQLSMWLYMWHGTFWQLITWLVVWQGILWHLSMLLKLGQGTLWKLKVWHDLWQGILLRLTMWLVT